MLVPGSTRDCLGNGKIAVRVPQRRIGSTQMRRLRVMPPRRDAVGQQMPCQAFWIARSDDEEVPDGLAPRADRWHHDITDIVEALGVDGCDGASIIVP